MKRNRTMLEKSLSPIEREQVKESLYRMFVEDDVAVVYIEDGQLKSSGIWDFVCRMAKIVV